DDVFRVYLEDILGAISKIADRGPGFRASLLGEPHPSKPNHLGQRRSRSLGYTRTVPRPPRWKRKLERVNSRPANGRPSRQQRRGASSASTFGGRGAPIRSSFSPSRRRSS